MRHLAASLLLAALALVAACGDERNDDRPVTDFNGVPYGSVCEVAADCGGGSDSCCTDGKCSPDGWCSPKCSSDQDCPSGFFCIDHSGTRCFAECADDRDCPVDWICEDKSGHKTCRYK